ncbi:MAG: flavin reductase [Candidatus Iainarchaeum archaeon]|uniref:Flavin reductase n=1 Tax=Candidatus Iainarchaeum sp. TaxID=3101447 RepID=A0A7T9DKL7_9ARCH|nr:MAG: flavin reductase [Candidatus Diapherotrites archaeon]
MNIDWGSPAAHAFITNVGIITSNGPIGANAMAAEWTHQISYSPGLIAVAISNHNDATAENIRATKEFGVNLAATDQDVASSISGKSSGKNIDKIAVLKELGFAFYAGKKIASPMLENASLNVECKLVHEVKLGSHTLFVGEAVDVRVGAKEPLAFHAGKYWKLDTPIQKPSDAERTKMKAMVAAYVRE